MPLPARIRCFLTKGKRGKRPFDVHFEEGRAYCFVAVRLSLCRSVHQYFPFIFFAEGTHTELIFSIYIYNKNIKVKFGFGYVGAIFDIAMPQELRKSFGSFCSFSSQRLYLLNWNLVYRSIIIKKFDFWYDRAILDSYATWTPKKFHKFAVSVHFVCGGCTYEKEILICRFIVIMSWSNSILVTNELF